MPQAKASLCGHYEVVQLLLESGALCERDTFQGERCLYNALNDRIRKLLLEYDYSKSTDPLQPFAAHITSLLTREHPRTSDILVTAAEESFRLHKFVLSARSPYFSKKLAIASDATYWKLPSTIPPQAFLISVRYLYFGEIPNDVGGGPGTGFTEDEVLEGLDKISKQLEVRSLWDGILDSSDRRLARQRRTDEVEKGRYQMESFFAENLLKHKVITTTNKAGDVRWDRDNSIFADILLRADDSEELDEDTQGEHQEVVGTTQGPFHGIPIGPLSQSSRSSSHCRNNRRSILFPAHRAMLLRSEYFAAMFSSSFREAQNLPYLLVVPIACTPEVLEIVLKFIYTEKADIPLELAVDVLYAADLLFVERLKMRAAAIISTLGNGNMTQTPSGLDPPSPSSSVSSLPAHPSKPDAKSRTQPEDLDIYEIIRAAWLLRVPRLEEFSARFLANRLECYIDEPEFEGIVKESAGRIKARQETDTIELLDDIRYYLSERFRLRFEDTGMDEMMEEEAEGAVAKGWDGPEADAVMVAVPVDDDDAAVAVVTLNTSASDANAAGEAFAAANTGTIRTLDGEMVEDELEGDAMNYKILLGKIDRLLERLKLDA